MRFWVIPHITPPHTNTTNSLIHKLLNILVVSPNMQQTEMYRKAVPHWYQWTAGWTGSNSGGQIQARQDCGWNVITPMTSLCSSWSLSFPSASLHLLTNHNSSKEKTNSSSYLKMQVCPPCCFSLLISPLCPPAAEERHLSSGLTRSRPPLPIIYGFISNTCQQRKRRRGRRELSSGSEESPSCRGGRQSTSVRAGLDSCVSTAVLCKWIAGSWLGGVSLGGSEIETGKRRVG